MKAVAITGSTRGIGYGLADSFLAPGCAVAISGRTLVNIEKAVAELVAKHEADRVLGQPCDVTDFQQVQQALWDAAQAHFGKIDIWINNAGIGHFQTDFWELSPGQIEAVVETNLVGAMYGAKVALRGMLWSRALGAFTMWRPGTLLLYQGQPAASNPILGAGDAGSARAGGRAQAGHGYDRLGDQAIRWAPGRLGARQAHIQHLGRPRRNRHALAGPASARQRQNRRPHYLADQRQGYEPLPSCTLSQA